MFHHRSSSQYARSVSVLFVFFFFILFAHTASATITPTQHSLYIRNDATGGDCFVIGTWNNTNHTCILTDDIKMFGDAYASIFLNDPGITFDGGGHTITGGGTGYGAGRGIYIEASNITVKNLTINAFLYGIDGYGGDHNQFRQLTLTNNYMGLRLNGMNNPVIDEVTTFGSQLALQLDTLNTAHISNITINDFTDGRFSSGLSLARSSNVFIDGVVETGTHGSFDLINSSNITVRDVTLSAGTGFNIESNTTDHNSYDIDTTTVGGKPVRFFSHLSNTTLVPEEAAAIYCVSCNYITIANYTFTGTPRPITLIDTQNALIEGNTFTGPAPVAGPSPLKLTRTAHTIIRNNTFHGYTQLYIDDLEPKDTLLYHNNFYDFDGSNPFSIGARASTILLSGELPAGGNYWEHYDTPAEGCNDVNSDHICDNPYHPTNSADPNLVLTDPYPFTTPIIPQCKDGIDNDGDGKVDTADSGCHTDFDASNATSYDPLIDNEDFMTSQYYTPLKDVTAQLAYPTSTPQGTAPNLLVLVHGCCNSKSDVQETWETLKSVIEPAIIQNAVAGPWEVLVWDWSSSTPKRGGVYSYSDAVAAYTNAFDQGSVLAKRIRDGHYKFVHFVGHSAGSNLIDHAARHLKVIDASDHPVIHITFLDAYTRNGSDKTYGNALESRDFAEQYVLKGDLPLTSSVLPHAYNFNVTGISPVGLGTIEAHGWPVEFYRASAINAGLYGFGLPVAFERSNQEDAATFYVNQKQSLLNSRNIKVGDECLLTSATACTTNVSPVVEQAISLTRLGTSAIIGGIEGIKKSITGAVDLLVGTLPTDIIAVFHSGSPVWFEIPLNTTEPYNILKFDYEFLSAAGAEGVMTVFVDDNPVFKIDERITNAGTTTTPDIPVGDLAPGQHRVGFRLDPFTDVQSSARVNNIQFGLLTESATTTDTVPPSTPTLLTALPTATSTITLTWATSTDNIGISGYQIFRATSSSAITTLIATTTASTTSYANTGLTASTTYWYQVKAADVAGNVSSSSNKVSTTTLKVITDTTPPTAPNSLTATAASTTIISLTWATSTDTIGVIGYKVERCIGAACTNFIQIATSTLTSYQNTGLAASTTYRFRVRAYDTAGNNSSYSTIVSTTTLPAATAPLTIFSDGFEGSVSWTKVAPVTWYTGSPKVGTHSARLQNKASIEKAKSLAGWKNITISFSMGANSLDTASENIQALYFNGSTWVILATIANGSANENNRLNPYTFTLPASMNGKTTFKLKFKINGSATDDYAFIDEVKVMGVK